MFPSVTIRNTTDAPLTFQKNGRLITIPVGESVLGANVWLYAQRLLGAQVTLVKPSVAPYLTEVEAAAEPGAQTLEEIVDDATNEVASEAEAEAAHDEKKPGKKSWFKSNKGA